MFEKKFDEAFMKAKCLLTCTINQLLFFTVCGFIKYPRLKNLYDLQGYIVAWCVVYSLEDFCIENVEFY